MGKWQPRCGLLLAHVALAFGTHISQPHLYVQPILTAVAFLADSACPHVSQNFFRSYPKLAGMTGTAATEVAEFNNIYNLNVAVVPTNKVRTVPTRCSAACDGA